MVGFIGARPGEVYDPSSLAQGRCPTVGTFAEFVGNAQTGGAITNIATKANGGDIREAVLVRVGAGQNLVNGTLIHYTGDYTTALPGSAGAGVPNLGPLAVVVASITASASQLVWAQVKGLANVIFDATTSAIPGAPVKLGATSGSITAAAVTTASNYISGMQVAATVSAAGLGAVLLNYPRVISG
jgi:hypothetical protein